jgi:cyclophilin family peptidyl-prolyl cis-trans isomerase/HEAT repeat protein
MLRQRPERWTLLLLLALGGAACAPTSAPQAPTPATSPARPAVVLGEAEIQGIAELLRLEDRREYDDDAIRTQLTAAHPELRRRAALAAGRVRDPRAADLLLQALDDTDAGVRAEAAFALGQLGDSSAHLIGALAARSLAPTEDAVVRAEAVAALGKLRSIESRITLEAILGSAATEEEAPPAAVVAEALLAIWKFRRVEGMTDPIAQLSRSRDLELRWRAVYALMRLGDPHTIATLLDRRHDADPLVRALALRGLRPAVVDSAGQHAPATAALAEATRDPHPHVRINALRALASFRLPEHTNTLARGLDDADANVVLAAAEALGESTIPTAAAVLEPLARAGEARIALRAAALAGLMRITPELGLPIAAALAEETDWLTRLYAARALAAAPETHGVPLLTELVHDPDPRVAAAALAGLAELRPVVAPGLERFFIEQLGAADVGVRAAALRGMAQRATAADLPALLDAYARAEHDHELNDAARAAVAALGALARQNVPVQRTFFRRFDRSQDPIVRREVREQLGPGDWGTLAPVETNQGVAFYEEIVRTLVAPDLAGAPRPRAIVHTAAGAITIELAPADAPLTVHNFMTLAGRGYFDGFRWHRVVPNFVLQDGDPRGDGAGGPGYSIRDELNRLRYLRGTVGMALDGADTGGSQFFITHAPQPHLDGGYTSFGQVVAGLEAADAVVQDDPILRIEIVQAVASTPAPGAPER